MKLPRLKGGIFVVAVVDVVVRDVAWNENAKHIFQNNVTVENNIFFLMISL